MAQQTSHQWKHFSAIIKCVIFKYKILNHKTIMN